MGLKITGNRTEVGLGQFRQLSDDPADITNPNSWEVVNLYKQFPTFLPYCYLSHFFPYLSSTLLLPDKHTPLSILSVSLMFPSIFFSYISSFTYVSVDKHIHAHASSPTLGITTAARLWGTGSFQRNNRTKRRVLAISCLPVLLLIAAHPSCDSWRWSMSDHIGLYQPSPPLPLP